MVTLRDLVTGATTVTEEQAVQRAHFTGTVAEKRFMERRWCKRQAMLRVDKRERNASIRAVDRAAKRQCKKDERQTEALLAKMRNWSADMFDCKRGFGDMQGGAGGGVPERRARGREEHGREAALARVPVPGHSRVGAGGRARRSWVGGPDPGTLARAAERRGAANPPGGSAARSRS